MDKKNPFQKSELNAAGISYTSLTEIEVESLNSQYGLADGHAYHDMPIALQPVVDALPTLWQKSKLISVPDMESTFKDAVAHIIESSTLKNKNHGLYSISPTASNSIDIVGAWLGIENNNVGLLEPVFDNLYLLLKRRNLNIKAIEERDLIELDKLEKKINGYQLKSIFIVNPNNPTGFQLSNDELRNLSDLCVHKNLTLIIDASFRLYSENNFDSYKILDESGVNYIVIEDTGKTWPTQDLKASLMVYSEFLARDLRILYEEVFLCTSNFSLAFLGELIEKTKDFGIDKIIWEEVSSRIQAVERAISNTPLSLVKSDGTCQLPLAWIDCTATGLTDLELVRGLKDHGIVLLPGRFFYWNSPDQHTSNVRLSLLKPDETFYKSLDVLAASIPKLITPSKPQFENSQTNVCAPNGAKTLSVD